MIFIIIAAVSISFMLGRIYQSRIKREAMTDTEVLKKALDSMNDVWGQLYIRMPNNCIEYVHYDYDCNEVDRGVVVEGGFTWIRMKF